MTLDELRRHSTITVPEAGRVLSIGRAAAYRAAEVGQIPTLRLGRRLVVPVPALLALLGDHPNDEAAPLRQDQGRPSSDPAA